jgi:hypothetical protein
MRLPPSLWEFTLPFSPVTLTPWPLAARELTLAARGSIRHHATQYVVAGSQVIAPERSVAARRCKSAPPLFASSPLSLDFSRAAILMREGNPHELVVLEEEACRAGPVLVLFLLEFAEDALRFLFLGFFLFVFRLFGRHWAGARIVLGKRLCFGAALETGMRLAGAGDDLSFSHAKIGRSKVASRSTSARKKTDDASCEGKPDKMPGKGAHGYPGRS